MSKDRSKSTGADPDVGSGLEAIAANLNYPMIIVTAASGSQRAGCLVGFSTQCSMNPFQYAVYLSTSNHTFDVALQATALAVHFLQADQLELARLFAEETGDTVDKFARCQWTPGLDGVPILSDIANWFAGPVVGRAGGDDHRGFIIEPVRAQTGPWTGQFDAQRADSLTAGHTP